MDAKLVAVCVLLTWVVWTDGRPCTANRREYVYVRYGQYQELQCCERDHAELSDTLWYKYDDESQSWELPAPETSDILFLERNATLAIKHAQFSDTGRYKCTRPSGKGKRKTTTGEACLPPPSGKSIQSDESGTEFDLKVVACDQLARGPFPIAPLPCGVTSAKVGDHVTIPCTRYFGCDQDDVRMVTWFMKAKANNYSSWAEVPAADDRITQIQIDNHDGVLASNLTVSNVEVRDAELEFVCILFSDQYVEGQTKVFTSLYLVNDKETRADASMLLPVIIIPAAAVSLVLVTLLAMCLCHLKARENFKSASDGNVSDVTRFIHRQIVTPDAVKPSQV